MDRRRVRGTRWDTFDTDEAIDIWRQLYDGESVRLTEENQEAVLALADRFTIDVVLGSEWGSNRTRRICARWAGERLPGASRICQTARRSGFGLLARTGE